MRSIKNLEETMWEATVSYSTEICRREYVQKQMNKVNKDSSKRGLISNKTEITTVWKGK